MRILEKHLIEVEFEGILKILKNVQDYVADEEELVGYIYDVSFPKWVYDEIPKLESDYLNQIWGDRGGGALLWKGTVKYKWE